MFVVALGVYYLHIVCGMLDPVGWVEWVMTLVSVGVNAAAVHCLCWYALRLKVSINLPVLSLCAWVSIALGWILVGAFLVYQAQWFMGDAISENARNVMWQTLLVLTGIYYVEMIFAAIVGGVEIKNAFRV